MGIKYSVEFENQTLTTANGDYDIFEFSAADDEPIELYGLFLNQTSELQEAQEEKLRLKVIRGHTTSSNGTSTTPQPLDPNGPAAGFTAETVGSTIASVGTPVDLHSDGWEVRLGYGLWWPEGSGIKTTQAAGLLIVRLMAATADDITGVSGTAYIEAG